MAKNKVEDLGKRDIKPSKRDRLEIVSAVIATTQQPSNFNQIAGHANLNYSTLKEYLRFMLGRCLIEKHDAAGRTPVYQASEKGNKFLELYCEGLIVLHGEGFLDNNSNLAEAYLLQYLRKNKSTTDSKQSKTFKIKTKNQRDMLKSNYANSDNKSLARVKGISNARNRE